MKPRPSFENISSEAKYATCRFTCDLPPASIEINQTKTFDFFFEKILMIFSQQHKILQEGVKIIRIQT